MKGKEVRELSGAELGVELQTLKDGLFKLRFRQVTENTRDANEVRKLHRDIARVRTVIRERELAQKKG